MVAIEGLQPWQISTTTMCAEWRCDTKSFFWEKPIHNIVLLKDLSLHAILIHDCQVKEANISYKSGLTWAPRTATVAFSSSSKAKCRCPCNDMCAVGPESGWLPHDSMPSIRTQNPCALHVPISDFQVKGLAVAFTSAVHRVQLFVSQALCFALWYSFIMHPTFWHRFLAGDQRFTAIIAIQGFLADSSN